MVGARPIGTAPLPLLRVAAAAGDAARMLGWQNPPLTRFRLNNMITEMVYETSELERIVGPLPFSEKQGVAITVDWLRNHNGLPKQGLAARCVSFYTATATLRRSLVRGSTTARCASGSLHVTTKSGWWCRRRFTRSGGLWKDIRPGRTGASVSEAWRCGGVPLGSQQSLRV